ncbi:hypothetical protein QJS04_geneDACA024868 [Acorus gramineus]|uniref:Uncharacterized protein n=1 Tax=Acorus gramineus TaxID=55184 RepID=A0AAV9ASX1_ACOGR|nr:hypothetical protein QJS04_geneDACA024868 [Acorus gramineus]
MWRRVLKMHFKERYLSMRGILTKVLGGSGEENAHLPNLNIRQNSDSSSTSSVIKLFKNELEKLRWESDFLDSGEKRKFMEILPGKYLSFPNGAIYHPPRYHCREAIYSKPYELFVKLHMEELKQKYPLVRECDYIYLIEKRIILFQMCKDIERRHELMVFLALDNYKDYNKKGNEKWKWIRGHRQNINLYGKPDSSPSASMICYLQLMEKDGKDKSEWERLTLVDMDRDKSLSDVKKRNKNGLNAR